MAYGIAFIQRIFFKGPKGRGNSNKTGDTFPYPIKVDVCTSCKMTLSQLQKARIKAHRESMREVIIINGHRALLWVKHDL